MSLKDLVAELRRRDVLKVAVAYVATSIVVLEVITHLFDNFEAPRWALKAVTSLLIIGFPIACLMAWGFEFKDGVVRPVPSVPRSEAASAEASRKGRSSGLLLTGLVLAVLLAGFALMQWRVAGPEAVSAPASTPVVVIMDTGAPRGVYDQDVRNAGGTNADSLTETLRDEMTQQMFRQLVRKVLQLDGAPPAVAENRSVG